MLRDVSVVLAYNLRFPVGLPEQASSLVLVLPREIHPELTMVGVEVKPNTALPCQ
jgi:hypothetical protein